MKKILISFLIGIGLLPTKVMAISARNMVAIDMDTNRILYEKKIHDAHLIASITKIMTAILAIENANIDSDVTTTETILESFGSAIYIEVGETMKLKDLIYGLMLRSGNDAALAIAEYVGKDVNHFVELMNAKAKEIGMNNTKFINPHGLENNKKEGNTSTAYDMAILTSYAMKNATYREIVKTEKYITKSDRKSYSWTNKNKMLTSYKYTTGGKTGYTEKAKRTLVSTASKDNKNIAIVTLNDPNDWEDHKTIYEELFKEYNSELVLDKENFKVENENYYKNNLYIKEDVYVLLKEEEKKHILLDIHMQKIPDYKEGDCVGTIEIKLQDQLLKEVNIYAHGNKKQEKKKESIIKKIIGWFKND